MIILTGTNESARVRVEQTQKRRAVEPLSTHHYTPALRAPDKRTQSSRDRIIRLLAPFVIRVTGLTRDKVIEFLCALSPEERYGVMRLRGAGLGRYQKRRKKA
jgi:hypothetical protein